MCPISTLPSHHVRARDQLVLGQVPTCLRTQFFRLHDCNFFASYVCLLVGEVFLEPLHASWQEDLVPACWWRSWVLLLMQAGLCQGAYLEVPIGSRCHQATYLLMDWACSHLVGCLPEVSQHWSFQAVGWGKISLPRTKNVYFQPEFMSLLCPPPAYRHQREPQPPQETSKTGRQVWPKLPWSHNLFFFFSFWSHCFAPGPSVCRALYVPSKNGVFPQSCGTPVIKPHWSSKPHGLGAPPPYSGPLD